MSQMPTTNLDTRKVTEFVPQIEKADTAVINNETVNFNKMIDACVKPFAAMIDEVKLSIEASQAAWEYTFNR